MAKYRVDTKNWLSQSVHLSYVASCLTVMAPVIGGADQLRPAIFGIATENSVSTIRSAAFTTWYFSRLGYNRVLGRDPSRCLLAFDKESDWQHRIAVGQEVLSSITLRHCHD
jgi:hypothetical protein